MLMPLVLRRYLRFSPPFDRHDWVVWRPKTNKKVRYIIDYYSLRKGINQDPEFHLDVRPAMDSPSNIKVRLMVMLEDSRTNHFHGLMNTYFLFFGVSLALAAYVTIVVL